PPPTAAGRRVIVRIIRLLMIAVLPSLLGLWVDASAAFAQWEEDVTVRAPADAFASPPPVVAEAASFGTEGNPFGQAGSLPHELASSRAASAGAEPDVVAEAASFGAEAEAFGQAGSLPHGAFSPTSILSPEELTPTLRTAMLVGMLSLVPALLVMTTCFARFAIVFGLLRQGLGAQQWLPNQIVLALSLFLTLLVMAPVWTQSYEQGLRPYVEGRYATPADQQAALETALAGGVQPVREFMSTQIAATGNEAALDMLLSYQQQ